MTPKVLLVCYYFPPLGMAGVSRPLNLFKHLPSFGYDCHILTVKPVAYRKYAPELLEGLDQTKIFRAGSRDPQRLMYLLGIREVNPKTIARGSKFGETLFPDSKIGWVKSAVRLGKKLHAKYQYQAVISTSPPISTHLVGMHLNEACGIKWVADFRDPWTATGYEQTYHREDMRQQGAALKRQILSAATAITAVNQSVANYWDTREVITNGFDPEVARLWTPPVDRDKFRIGLLGTFDNDFPVEPLFRTLKAVADGRTLTAEQIEILQVGEVDRDWLMGIATRHGLEATLRFHGLRPRDESARLLSCCALMYIGLAPKYRGATTSRLFDLLASGRPILAYGATGGDLAKELTESDHCLFTDETTSAAGEFVAARAHQFFAGQLAISPLPAHALKHAWSNKARQFADVLRRIG